MRLPMRKTIAYLPLMAMLAVSTADVAAEPHHAQGIGGRPGAILREAERNKADYDRAARRRFEADMQKMFEIVDGLLALGAPFDDDDLRVVRDHTSELEERVEDVIEYVGFEDTAAAELEERPREVSTQSIVELVRLIRRATNKVSRVTSDREILDLGLLRDAVASLKATHEYSLLLREAASGS